MGKIVISGCESVKFSERYYKIRGGEKESQNRGGEHPALAFPPHRERGL
jgi:hypothetical protein